MRIVLIAAMILSPVAAFAGDCRIVTKTFIGQNVITSTGSIVVPYSTPVAVPTSVVVSGYTYQAAQPQVDPAEWAAFQQWKRSHGTVNALGASLVSQNCAACHAKDGEAKDHFDLTQPLTADMKIAAAKALLSGSMPKGKTIDDKTRGNLLGELMEVEKPK